MCDSRRGDGISPGRLGLQWERVFRRKRREPKQSNAFEPRRRRDDQRRRDRWGAIILAESGDAARGSGDCLAQRRYRHSPRRLERQVGGHGRPRSRRLESTDGDWRCRRSVPLRNPSRHGRQYQPGYVFAGVATVRGTVLRLNRDVQFHSQERRNHHPARRGAGCSRRRPSRSSRSPAPTQSFTPVSHPVSIPVRDR